MEDQERHADEQHIFHFDVEGMTCAACVNNVEQALRKVDGIDDVAVNLAMESATVTLRAPVQIRQLQQVVERAGYRLETAGSASLVERQQRSIRNWKRLLIIQASFGVPLLFIAMLHMLVGVQLYDPAVSTLIQLVLATVMVVTGRDYYRRGFRHLIQLMPNMDTLVALGTGSAYLFSLLTTFNSVLVLSWPVFNELYFEASGAILLFITFGKWLEAMARGKTTEALTGLSEQLPREALVRRDGGWTRTALRDVLIDDEVLVKPHQTIPVDGVIIEGGGHVNESSISGEPLPMNRQIGDRVLSATQNLEGRLVLCAEKIGRDSTFGQIITLVENAQGRKPGIQQLADRVAAIFVPVVMVLALITGLIWLSLGFGIPIAFKALISVLIIACPCALGLATPTAIVMGSGLLARRGILVKDPDALQVFSEVRILVFDKTGTLTTGQPRLVETYPRDETEYVVDAAALESQANHPFAAALLKYCNSKDLRIPEVTDIAETPGQGISGLVNGSKLEIRAQTGNDVLGDEFHERLSAWKEKGYSASLVFREGSVVGLLAFDDPPRRDASSTINALRETGISTLMLTGDQAHSARRLAREVGIQEFRAGVKPQDKYEEIKALRRDKGQIAMIGDGINDAPALVEADVGLSFQSGIDIAVNAADIILMRPELAGLITTHAISAATFRKIRQNLFWAFIYNLIGIPIAMGILYPFFGVMLNPMFAGLAMAFSSVSVVGNTLLLRLKKF